MQGVLFTPQVSRSVVVNRKFGLSSDSCIIQMSLSRLKTHRSLFSNLKLNECRPFTFFFFFWFRAWICVLSDCGPKSLREKEKSRKRTCVSHSHDLFYCSLYSRWLGLNTHLYCICMYQNHCIRMDSNSQSQFSVWLVLHVQHAEIIHCCSATERRWQWLRALFLCWKAARGVARSMAQWAISSCA